MNDQDKHCSPAHNEISARQLIDLFKLLFEKGESAFVSKFVHFKIPDKSILEWSQGGETSYHLLHKFNENSAQLANIKPIFANDID